MGDGVAVGRGGERKSDMEKETGLDIWGDGVEHGGGDGVGHREGIKVGCGGSRRRQLYLGIRRGRSWGKVELKTERDGGVVLRARFSFHLEP